MIAGVTAAADWIVILPVIIGLLGAAVLLMLRRSGSFQGGLALLFVAAIIVCDVQLLQRVLAEGPVAMTMGNWLPPFGITFAADLLGAALALTGAVATLCVLVFALADRSGMRSEDGFFALVLLLLAGVSGAFLTGDLFNLYVWFEVLLIASFGLLVIGRRAAQLDAAVKYGFLNYLGTTIFLISLGLLYGATGTLNMADLVATAPGADRTSMLVIGALFLLAFGIKAAAFPANAWLPASYHTASPALSALFAALLTKVGVYALLRTMVALIPAVHDDLESILVAVAIGTLIIAPLGAIAETNLRRALGFLVIGGIGMTIAGIALGGQSAVAGGALYMLQSILTLTALYLVAGLVEATTGATDTREMGGVYAGRSLVSILFLVLALSVAGLPPLLGFWPKVLLLQGGFGEALAGGAIDLVDLLLIAAILLNALLTMVAVSRLWSHIFWRPGALAADGSDGPAFALVAPTARQDWLGTMPAFVLTVVVVLLGLWPDPLIDGSLDAAAGLLDPSGYVDAVFEEAAR